MIPTAYKDRLPKNLTYALSVSPLTDALADVPQIENFTLSFHRSSAAGGAATSSTYPVIVCQYQYSPLGMSECNELAAEGFYGPKWALAVHAIPAEFGAIAREQLFTVGLPALKSWLFRKRSDLWYESSHEFALLFSPSTASILLPGAV